MRHPWAVTVAATAISTYALDTVATAAGVLLVASHALDGLEQWHALVLLAGTNLGAAAYEFGLARLTRSVLRLPHNKPTLPLGQGVLAADMHPARRKVAAP